MVTKLAADEKCNEIKLVQQENDEVEQFFIDGEKRQK